MKDSQILLDHILESIEAIESFIDGVDYETFCKVLEKQDAVQRRLEIIGEAVKHLPEELKGKQKEIPWRSIASMRDLLIHEYFNVSLEQVWTAVTEDLPILKKQLREMKTL